LAKRMGATGNDVGWQGTSGQNQKFCKISPHLPEVFLDPLRLKQVLLNLLLNAIEASPEGESVGLDLYHKRKNIIIDVRDHGCGLPPGKKEEIFSPFFTTKSKGTGLGLPIAKKIVEAHEGMLEVLENPAKGVTFRVIIPMKTFNS
jgi:two-component system, NtrC family, sensor histidine kinase HydH